MKQFLKKYWLNILVSFYALIVALFWTALRVNWAGISKALGADKNPSFIVMNLPLLVCIAIWLFFAWSVIGSFIYKNKKRHWIGVLIADVICTGLIVGVYIGGSYDYIQYIIPKFLRSLACAGCILVLAFFIFVPFKNTKVNILWKSAVLIVAITITTLVGYQIRPNGFSYDSVVYAVEDDYQIIFSTSDNSIAWVEVGGEKFYDLYAGSMKSNDRVHKIVVPQEKLDKSKSYTINAQKMIYRGPFGGILGKVISKKHNFKPVDVSDGFVYYSISDVHCSLSGAVNAASKQKNLDLLVLAGDLTSMVDSEYDANFANRVAFEITKGEFPVIYARGNHEIKGLYAEDLYKYVGTKGDSYYYKFSLSNKIGGIVLDLGEDHDAGWWEYFGTDRFEIYQAEQTEFLNNIKKEKYLDGFDYKLTICHIPIPFVNSRHNHVEIKKNWTEILNELDIDLYLSGHQHDLNVFEPGKVTPNEPLYYNKNFRSSGSKYNGYLTDFKFRGFIVARAAMKQTGDTQMFGNDEFTGLYTIVDFSKKTETSKFTNSNGEIVPVCNMWTTEKPQTEFVWAI